MDQQIIKFYLLSWKQHKNSFSAFSLENIGADEFVHKAEDKLWLPLFELRRITETKTGILIDKDLKRLSDVLPDYISNESAVPMMSEKLKKIVDSLLTGKEEIEWITCNIRFLDKQVVYYILRFKKKLDVLDFDNTLFVEGTDVIIRPCFSLQKIKPLSVFHQPSAYDFWKIPSAIYVSESLKKYIQKEKCTGVDFEKTFVV